MHTGAARHRSTRVRLHAVETEVANSTRRGGRGQVKRLDHPRRAPPIERPDQVGNTCVTFPPVLVGVLLAVRRVTHASDSRYEGRVRRIRHIPHLVTLVAIGPKKIGLLRISAGKFGARTHLHHLGALRTPGGGYVMQVRRSRRVGHIENRCPVDLDIAGERVERLASVMAYVEDATVALRNRKQMICRPRLEIMRPHQASVAALLAVALGKCHRGKKTRQTGCPAVTFAMRTISLTLHPSQ